MQITDIFTAASPKLERQLTGSVVVKTRMLGSHSAMWKWGRGKKNRRKNGQHLFESFNIQKCRRKVKTKEKRG